MSLLDRRRFIGSGLAALLVAVLPIPVRAEDERPPVDDPEALREWWKRQRPGWHFRQCAPWACP